MFLRTPFDVNFIFCPFSKEKEGEKEEQRQRLEDKKKELH